MKKYKVLNIKGVVLDKYQLEKYLQQLASDNILKQKSDKDTYPIPRMRENFEIITATYNLLNEHIKLKIPIHSAGEWLLDNYYIIEEVTKAIEKELSIKKYTNFLGIQNGGNKGFARIYVLATEIVAYSDAKINIQNLKDYLRAYQEKKTLSMDEIWNLGTFMNISIIEKIRDVCEKIYTSQLQKYKVENIIERLVENKKKEELIFQNKLLYKTAINEYSEMKYPFIEYMSCKLKRYGKKAYPFLNILEEQVVRMGTDISEVIKKEHFDIAVKRVSIGNCITSIKTLQRINFIDIFEEINQVEEILKKDPVNTYDKMDYKTKIAYRNKIKQISKKTKISEIYIAKKCLELAQNNLYKSNSDIKKSHIGYYLIKDGKIELLEILQNKKIKRIDFTTKMGIYLFVKTFLTLITSIIFIIYIYSKTGNILISIIGGILLYIPIEIIVLQVIQYILGKVVKPTLIPKLDFQKGVPEDYATFVVIPTILNNKEKVKELMKKIEIYYLANKSNNLYFALLGDCTTSDKENENFDEEIEKEGIKCVEELNKKYPDVIFQKFSFIYRKRVWNENEGAFLGWERKRGLLNQFNEYILGNINNPFKVCTIEENKQNIPNIKYIITLDSDTELVLNSGLELIGAMAHILNKPKLNEEKILVIERTWTNTTKSWNSFKRNRKNKIYKNICRNGRNRFLYKCYL